VVFQAHPPRSPSENFTDPGLMSVCVSLISDEIFITVRVRSISDSRPPGSTKAYLTSGTVDCPDEAALKIKSTLLIS
jgi:hypothetical protein